MIQSTPYPIYDSGQDVVAYYLPLEYILGFLK